MAPNKKKLKLKQREQIKRALARRKTNKFKQGVSCGSGKGMKILAVSNFAKFDIDLGYIFAGITAKSCKKGEQVPVIQREFTSSEDGDVFISRLEQFPSLLLNKIKDQHQNDIADVRELVFQDIEISDGVGVMVLFSVGWRKGLFYDLSSLSDKNLKRDYNLNQLLGGYYAYLSFQERFKISDSEWQSLLQNGWFPFITLKTDLINSIINHNREGWNIDDLLTKIQEDVLRRLPDGLKSWANIKAFAPHMDFISKAAEHYQKNDPISCISVLFPRIEGIMREFQAIQGQPEKAGQKDLASTVLSPGANPKDHKFSPLLPLRFNQYLTEVYFAKFDPTQADNALSRNTVGHGVATKENFDLKGSTLGFLILDQLSYYFCGIG